MARGKVVSLNGLAALVAALAAAAAISGCATTPANSMVPETFALPEDSQRFDGSVAVNVTVDVPSLRLVRPRQIFTIDGLADWLGVRTEALVASIGGNDLYFPVIDVGNPAAPTLVRESGLLRVDWTVTVPVEEFGTVATEVIATAPAQYALQWSRELAARIRDAVERSLVGSSLFPRVATGPADYVVDVWVEGYEPTTPKMGFGTFLADVLSIWRLTRASDGEVLACDFADGHGAWGTRGFGPAERALDAAVQQLIGKGLVLLADRSRKHLDALEPAGLGRRGAGWMLPAASAEWRARVRRNWAQLRAGMSVDEVVAAIGPVRMANDRLDRIYTVPVSTQEFSPKKGDPSIEGLGVLEFVEYRTDVYSLLFVSRRMYRWDGDAKENRLERVSPPTLLIWQLSEE